MLSRHRRVRLAQLQYCGHGRVSLPRPEKGLLLALIAQSWVGNLRAHLHQPYPALTAITGG